MGKAEVHRTAEVRTEVVLEAAKSLISVDKFLSTAGITDPHLTRFFCCWGFFTGCFVKMGPCACVVPVGFAVFTRDVSVALRVMWMLCKSGGIGNISILFDGGWKTITGMLREEKTRCLTSLVGQYVVFLFLTTNICHRLVSSSLVEKTVCFGEELWVWGRALRALRLL